MTTTLIAPNLAAEAEHYEDECGRRADAIERSVAYTLDTPAELQDLIEGYEPDIYAQLARLIRNLDGAIRECRELIHVMPHTEAVLQSVSQLKKELIRVAEQQAGWEINRSNSMKNEIGKLYDHNPKHFKFPRSIENFDPEPDASEGDRFVWGCIVAAVGSLAVWCLMISLGEWLTR